MIEATLDLIGRSHMVLLHLPISFVLLLAVIELSRSFRDRWRGEPAAGLGGGRVTFVVITALLTTLTSWTGWVYAERDFGTDATLDLHRWIAVSGAALMVIAAAAAVISRATGPGRAVRLYRAFTVLAAITVGVASHFGGELVHGRAHFGEPLARLFAGGDGEPSGAAAPEPTGPMVAADADDASPADAGAPVSDLPGPDQAFGSGATFQALVLPIFEARCIRCHGPRRSRGDLRVDSVEALTEGDWAVVVPGAPELSELILRITLPDDDLDRMPPDGDPLTAEQIETIRAWIEAAPSPEASAVAPE